MAAPFRLQAGDPAPHQQSPTTCGSASLTVARMLVDPGFARWITAGLGRQDPDDGPADPRVPLQRFAAYEQIVAARTNSVLGPGGRLQAPWPRALGTPPWGARAELEHGAAAPHTPYDVGWFRWAPASRLAQVHRALCARVRPGRPALLYVGNAWLPRHVVLLMPPTDGQQLDVYEPSSGRVVDLPEGAFVSRRLRLAGWDVPWAAVSARP